MNENMETTVMDEVSQGDVCGGIKMPLGAKIALGVTIVGGAGFLIYKGIKKAAGAIKAAKAAKKDECIECEYTDVTEA